MDVRLDPAAVMDRAGGSADVASTQSASATDAVAAARESKLDYAGFSRFELELEVCVWPTRLFACQFCFLPRS